MNIIKDFFDNLGFDFNKNLLKSKEDFFCKNINLKKTNDKVFFYENPSQTNTSFYLITTELSPSELESVRKFIWNESKADLVFYTFKPSNNNTLFREDFILELHYAKVTPKVSIEESKIDSFNPSQKDLEKINNISRWQFDSGAFWLNYNTFLKKANYKSIDKELVTTLKSLKDSLNFKLKKVEKNNQIREEIVQAIIDRTLYIKYLEDNHIINSYFYSHYFKSQGTTYQTLLSQNKIRELNRLFKLIHRIFNNSLFDKPNIKDEYLTKDVCELLYTSFNTNLKTKQIRLFDFQFNVIPVEFISYVYEIFLSDKQKENGIYYTPKKLAQLIIDDVIPENKIGKVLDPSCGSGMFLIVAFQKLLENSGNNRCLNIEQEIEFRIKLLSENIFGIEKEITAQRFTIFSLSLQLFRGLEPTEVKEYIASQLEQNKEVELFKKYSFFENILCNNSLSIENSPFEGATFDYIIGNPPFFEIKQRDDEINFLNNYEVETKNDCAKANTIVGKHQISQCFFLKIKDWSKENTRFGFVSNSSNFYNDNSSEFQSFFYKSYGIEKIYELSKVKKILFEKATESVVVVIFTNQLQQDNVIDYFPVEMGLFSAPPFELLIINEGKTIQMKQSDLARKEIRLRDFMVGNEYDIELLNELNSLHKLDSYILKYNNNVSYIHEGLKIVGYSAIKKEFNVNEESWDKLDRNSQIDFFNSFRKKHTNNKKTQRHYIELLKPSNIFPFVYKNVGTYLGDKIDSFERPRNIEIYQGDKIIFNRTGNYISALFSQKKIYFDFDLHVLKLKNKDLYYLFTAIINSFLINYYLDVFVRKRLYSSYPKIGNDDIKQIPIPKELDNDLVKKISKISNDLTDKKYEYSDNIAKKLNELIFDLYDLSYLEKQRVRDHFLLDKKAVTSKKEQELYKSTLTDSISLYFKSPVRIEFYKGKFNLIVLKISLNDSKNVTPTAKHTSLYILNEIFSQNSSENFLALREIIFGNDCAYIIKNDEKANWSETKAFEDGQGILKHIR